MHILSIFPEAYTYALIGPFILRLTLGFIFIYFAYDKIHTHKKEKLGLFSKISTHFATSIFWTTTLIELVGGVFLVIGLYLQPIALLLGILMFFATYMKIMYPESFQSAPEFYILLTAALFSLIFMGPGFWAFDLPL